jgi:hypothetical protein
VGGRGAAAAGGGGGGGPPPPPPPALGHRWGCYIAGSNSGWRTW